MDFVSKIDGIGSVRVRCQRESRDASHVVVCCDYEESHVIKTLDL